jgi:formylglycine-generating enzyme required for sulfatase activity
MLVILGASGSGKSSFMRAGLWPRLKRDDRHFYPLPVIRPERHAITGQTGLVTSLEMAFRERSAVKNRADIHQCLKEPDGLDRLLEELQQLAGSSLETEALRQTLIMPIDQGEELFASDGRDEAEQLLTHLGRLLAPPNVDEESIPSRRLHAVALIAVRSDSYARLQGAGPVAHVKQTLFDLKPIHRVEYKTIIEGPAQQSTAAGRKLTIDPLLTTQLIDKAEGADALPLLAFILERLCVEYGADGDLKLSEYQSLGGIAGSIETAIKSAFANPQQEPAISTDDSLRLLQLRGAFIPWLAWIDPDTEEVKRRIARWDDMPTESRPLIERLIGARLLLKDQRAVPGRETTEVVIEIAHEALLRQWTPLVAWLSEEATNLKAMEAVKRAAAEWMKEKNEAWLLHVGERLATAEALLRRQDLSRLLGEDADKYLRACRAREETARVERETMLQRQLDLQKACTEEAENGQRHQRYLSYTLGGLLLLVAGIAVTTWLWQKGYSFDQALLKVQSLFVNIHVAPEMQPVSGGTFRQGDTHGDRTGQPVREVTIRPFAIGRFEVTFEEYDRFSIATDQRSEPDEDWGRGRRPFIKVSWQEAKMYADWLSRQTGKRYRLPTESEWEYAARSGGKDDIWAGTSDEGQLKDYAVYNTSRTQPVGEKKPNGLGLYDMSGNVWEWAEDCWHKSYDSAPMDGSAWLGGNDGDCGMHVLRGGSWSGDAGNLLSSRRNRADVIYKERNVGFRLAQDID